ncbi:sla2 Src-like adaptor 2 [Globomyces sp. JEL0801]|nr:sla2 Src-like adaptor 2 [Globomyces sp. JEL0801]
MVWNHWFNLQDKQLALVLSKTLSRSQITPKQKHINACIDYTHFSNGAGSLWLALSTIKLAKDVTYLKTIYLIHHILLKGHPDALIDPIATPDWMESVLRKSHLEFHGRNLNDLTSIKQIFSDYHQIFYKFYSDCEQLEEIIKNFNIPKLTIEPTIFSRTRNVKRYSSTTSIQYSKSVSNATSGKHLIINLISDYSKSECSDYHSVVDPSYVKEKECDSVDIKISNIFTPSFLKTRPVVKEPEGLDNPFGDNFQTDLAEDDTQTVQGSNDVLFSNYATKITDRQNNDSSFWKSKYEKSMYELNLLKMENELLKSQMQEMIASNFHSMSISNPNIPVSSLTSQATGVHSQISNENSIFGVTGATVFPNPVLASGSTPLMTPTAGPNSLTKLDITSNSSTAPKSATQSTPSISGATLHNPIPSASNGYINLSTYSQVELNSGPLQNNPFIPSYNGHAQRFPTRSYTIDTGTLNQEVRQLNYFPNGMNGDVRPVLFHDNKFEKTSVNNPFIRD